MDVSVAMKNGGDDDSGGGGGGPYKRPLLCFSLTERFCVVVFHSLVTISSPHSSV